MHSDSLHLHDTNTENPVNYRALPYRVRMIAEKIGMEATYKLLTEHCHRCLYIPPTLENSDLANLVGEAAARALVELWPESSQTLPKPDKIIQQWRNHELLKLKHSGKLTTSEACKKYNLTRQRINQIENENQDNPNLALDLTL